MQNVKAIINNPNMNILQINEIKVSAIAELRSTVLQVGNVCRQIYIHFQKNHTFDKIFNRNQIKLSYNCMQNIKAIINNLNMNILQINEIKDKCNCRIKKYCPSGEKCLSSNIVYRGKITSTQPNYNEKVYFGVAEKSFKDLKPH